MAMCLHKIHSSLQVHLLHHSDVILMMSYGGVIVCWLMSLVGVDDVIGDSLLVVNEIVHHISHDVINAAL